MCKYEIDGKPSYKFAKVLCTYCYGRINKPVYYYKSYGLYISFDNLMSCPQLNLHGYSKQAELIEEIKVQTRRCNNGSKNRNAN